MANAIGRLCIGSAAVVQGGTREHVASQLLQPTSGGGDVILARQSGERRDKANAHRRLGKEGIV